MPSKFSGYKEAFVWIWLPGETEPVVAGKLTARGPHLVFNYGQSYLNRLPRIALSARELPLQSGLIPLLNGLSMPGCIRDGAPDAWGRRVLIHRKLGTGGRTLDLDQVDELTYLLESGSDRIGALDFQLSPTVYEPRSTQATLDELLEAAERVENGVPLTVELASALQHGTAIGGARPKALVESDHRKYIAKFSSSSDVYSVIKAEFVAMRLARIAGLTVAEVRLERSLNKDVLLIERFDRIKNRKGKGWQRKGMVSALTLLELDEMMARYASYEALAEIVRQRFADASHALEELFLRLTFNILVGNTDDHARNHAAFWDGQVLTLTPAYDICPQARTGTEANQAMIISSNGTSKPDDRRSQLETCLAAASCFLLSRKKAIGLIEHQLKSIVDNWVSVCDFATTTVVERKFFASRQFLNPYAFENLGSDATRLREFQRAFKAVAAV